MINRYQIEDISNIWSEENRFKTFLKTELALIESLKGKELAAKIKSKAKINIHRIHEIEKEVKHDIIAFCSSITEQLNQEEAKYFHWGVTSSDIIDTSINLMIKDSLDLILESYLNLLSTLKGLSSQYSKTLCLGRSHGIYAEPMVFGQKFLSFYAEFKSHYKDLLNFYENHLTAQFSGAVGNYTILSPEIEETAAKLLNLKVEPVSSQVIPRYHLAKLISINALIASAIERSVVEIRHLQHSDVNEIAEGFSSHQKGSSTMPHKKNPISSENLTGMARTLRSHLSIALENIPLWHERDISHSSAERMYLPDNLGLMLYSLRRLNNTFEDLVVNEDLMKRKLLENPQVLSSYLLHQVLEKTTLKREEAYTIIQEACFNSPSLDSLKAFLSNHIKLKSFNIDWSLPEGKWLDSFSQVQKRL